MPDHHSLPGIASNARKFLETVWPDWQHERHQRYGCPMPAVMSYSTCASSSTFLQKVLDGFGVISEVRHGWFLVEPSSSPLSSETRHTWVVSGPWLIDITADQFGADEVIVTSRSDDRYRSDVDVALPEFRLLRIQSVLEIWDRWLASPMREKLTVVHKS